MITIQIASIPEREHMLEKTIKSLRKQCDRIWVGLNNYKAIPKFLGEQEASIFDNKTGDAVKFYGAENLEGYVLTCDDDLIYPKDYVAYMTNRLYEYSDHGVCAVTLHGKEYHRPIRAFNKTLRTHRCLGIVPEDAYVDVVGTGVLCYHTDLIKVSYNDFKRPNMADLWFSKLAKEQGMYLVCLIHESGFLKYQEPEWTIWEDTMKKNFEEQTALLKTFL